MDSDTRVLSYYLTISTKMSLNKAIKSGKEKRKPYRGAKACSKRCRNNGSCSYCESNRTHKNRKGKLKSEYKD